MSQFGASSAYPYDSDKWTFKASEEVLAKSKELPKETKVEKVEKVVEKNVQKN